MQPRYNVIGYRPQRKLATAMLRGIKLGKEGVYRPEVRSVDRNEIIGWIIHKGREIVIGQLASCREAGVMHKLGSKHGLCVSHAKGNW